MLGWLRRYRELGGEFVTLGSDTHQVRRFGENLDLAKVRAKQAGIRYIATYTAMQPSSTRSTIDFPAVIQKELPIKPGVLLIFLKRTLPSCRLCVRLSFILFLHGAFLFFTIASTEARV